MLAVRWRGRRDGEPVIWGMAAGYVNSANLGLPVALHVLGDASFMAGLPLRNPIILGSALGVAVSVSDVPLPVVAQTTLTLLAAAAVPRCSGSLWWRTGSGWRSS